MTDKRRVYHWTDNGQMRVVTKYKKVHPDAIDPVYGTSLSAGFDLAPCEDIEVHPGRVTLASTGLVIQAPPQHMLYITFRSSTPRKWGVTVLEGIVDEDYCGDDDILKIQLATLPESRFSSSTGIRLITAGTRIAQGIFVPVTRAYFHEVTDGPIATSRGGFGSTG